MIVKEMVDFAAAYDVDGINLDYIRTVGTSFSRIARERYEKLYAGSTPEPRPVGGAVEAIFSTEGTVWTTETYKFAAPRYVSGANGRGYEITCDFSLGDPGYPRCHWDATPAAPADLTCMDGLVMNMRVTNAESIKGVACYLRSNGRWHISRFVEALAEGTNTVVFDQASYRREGASAPCRPESLNSADMVRLNVFPKAPTAKPAAVEVTGVRAVRSRIDELKGPMTPDVEARFLQWQANAVSDIVRRTSEGVRAAKPKAVISTDGHPLVKPQLDKQGRNEWLWLEKGWLDVAYNMDYTWRPDFRAYEAAAKSAPSPQRCVQMLGNYDTEKGKVFPRNAQQVARIIDYARTKYPRGIALYVYDYLADDQVKALREGPFKEDAVPDWPERQGGNTP
jgi:hypothetical protein